MNIFITVLIVFSLTAPTFSNSTFYEFNDCGGGHKSYKEYFTEPEVVFEPEIPRSGEDAWVTVTSHPFKSYYANYVLLRIKYQGIQLWYGKYDIEQECIAGAPCSRRDYFPSKWGLAGIYDAESVLMDNNGNELMCTQVRFKLSGPVGKEE